MKEAAAFCFSAIVVILATLVFSHGFHPFGAPSIDIQHGKQVFEENCAGCHAIELGKAAGLGPSLSDISTEAGQRIEGMTAEQFILQSILYPDAYKMQGAQGAMPAAVGSSLNDSEITDLLAYLMNTGGEMNIERLASLEIKRPASAEVSTVSPGWQKLQQGQALFSGKLGCNACHEILDFASSNFLAPSLKDAAILDEEYIRESIRDPSAIIAPTYRDVTLTTLEGVVYTGREFREDSEVIEIVSDITFNPTRKLFQKKELKSIQYSDVSIMPPYNLSQEDEDLLVAYLKFLGSD